MAQNDNNNEQLSYSDLIKIERIKCIKDPAYFMRKYVYIKHPVRGRIHFDLYPFQEKVLQDFKAYNKNIVLKSRQLGISTLSSAYALWLMTFFANKTVLCLAIKQATAMNIIKLVRTAYDNLPSWLKLDATENNKTSLTLVNGSNIKAVSGAPSSARSEALSLLIMDEAAFIKDADEVFASAQQALAAGGQAIVLSTPNGVGNFFYTLWCNAENGLNEFHPIYLRWDVHPERDINWRKKQDEDLGLKLAAQECDCSFITSGNTVIDGENIDWYKRNRVTPPIEERYDRALWIWERPNYTKQYVIGADVARGDGKDFSAFHVIRLPEMEQVAEYKAKVSTTDYAHILVAIATEYNNAFLAVENNHIGWSTVSRIVELGYKNLLYSLKKEYIKTNPNAPKQNTRPGPNNPNSVPGFSTTPDKRSLMMNYFQESGNQHKLLFHSERMLDELRTFIFNGKGRPEARKDGNDDLVMSFCISIWSAMQDLTMDSNSINMDKACMSAWTTSVDTSKNGYLDNKTKALFGWAMPIGGDPLNPTFEDLTQYL